MPGNEIKEMEGQNQTGLRSRQENSETFPFKPRTNITCHTFRANNQIFMHNFALKSPETFF